MRAAAALGTGILVLCLAVLGVAAPEVAASRPHVAIVVVNRRGALHLRVCLRALREALHAVDTFTWEATIVEGDGGGPGSLARQAFLTSCALFPSARLVFNDSGQRLSLAAATRHATAALPAGMHHVVFVKDTVEVSRGALERMVGILEGSVRIAVVGAASATPDGNIFHRGVAFDWGPRHKPCLSSDAYEDSFAHGSYRDAGVGSGSRSRGAAGASPHQSLAVWAFHAGQGLRAVAQDGGTDGGIETEEGGAVKHTIVKAVSDGCWGVRWRAWREEGGLDARVAGDGLAVVDLCLRLRRRLYLTALQDAELVMHNVDPPADTAGGAAGALSGAAFGGLGGSDRGGGGREGCTCLGENVGGVLLDGVMDERWGAELMAGLVQWQVSVPVLLSMECGDDQVRGLTTEAVHLVVALSARAFVIPQVEPESLNLPPSILHPPPCTLHPQPSARKPKASPRPWWCPRLATGASAKRRCGAVSRLALWGRSCAGCMWRRRPRGLGSFRCCAAASVHLCVPCFHASGSLCACA